MNKPKILATLLILCSLLLPAYLMSNQFLEELVDEVMDKLREITVIDRIIDTLTLSNKEKHQAFKDITSLYGLASAKWNRQNAYVIQDEAALYTAEAPLRIYNTTAYYHDWYRRSYINHI